MADADRVGDVEDELGRPRRGASPAVRTDARRSGAEVAQALRGGGADPDDAPVTRTAGTSHLGALLAAVPERALEPECALVVAVERVLHVKPMPPCTWIDRSHAATAASVACASPRLQPAPPAVALGDAPRGPVRERAAELDADVPSTTAWGRLVPPPIGTELRAPSCAPWRARAPSCRCRPPRSASAAAVAAARPPVTGRGLAAVRREAARPSVSSTGRRAAAAVGIVRAPAASMVFKPVNRPMP